MRGPTYIIRIFLLFLFAFAVSRMIFLCFFWSSLSHETAVSILSSFYYALKTDISAASYLVAIPVLMVLTRLFFDSGFLSKLQRAYVPAVLFINALVTSADPALYREWGIKTSYKALLYLSHPSEVLSTATTAQLLIFVLLVMIQFALGYFIYEKLIIGRAESTAPYKAASFVGTIFLIPFLILGIRGGMQQIPVQAADSYYSTNAILNWAAVNSLWGLGQSIAAANQYGSQNPYRFYPKAQAEQTVDALYAAQKDQTPHFLKTSKPNIVLIIFEGWSADLIESISANHERSCTPHFDKLASHGLLFTDCLASGERSDQGVAAILSSFPSLPLSSIVNYPEKVNQRPSILRRFKDRGYTSLFLFGGQLSYGNLKTLIYHDGFDKVIEEKDIDRKISRGRLGVHDEYTFDILSHELHTMRQPFFSGFFTQSTHFSYDYPGTKKALSWAGDQSDYANALMYADSCLGDFFDKVKKEDWYGNTLFIMVSDHSHILPWNDNHKTSALHHIPLLFYGDVIKDEYRGIKKGDIVSQQDICATLLSQLDMDYSDFKWSRDIMAPNTIPFAYWTFTEGFGFTKGKDCEIVYDLANRKIVSGIPSCDSDTIRREGFSYLQRIFDDFIVQ